MILIEWVKLHPVWTLLGVSWFLWNVMKRFPQPEKQPWKTLWVIGETICVLSWDRWGGTLKTIPVQPPSETIPKDSK
jgi:hypothetical protein